jgi:hypothetical protein
MKNALYSVFFTLSLWCHTEVTLTKDSGYPAMILRINTIENSIQSIEIYVYTDKQKAVATTINTSSEMNTISIAQRPPLAPLLIHFEDPLFFRDLTKQIEAALPSTDTHAVTKLENSIAISLDEIQPDSPWFDLYRAVLKKVCIFIIIPDDPFYWDLSMF